MSTPIRFDPQATNGLRLGWLGDVDLADGGRRLVLRLDGQIVGGVTLRGNELHDLVIEAPFRRRGYARLLRMTATFLLVNMGVKEVESQFWDPELFRHLFEPAGWVQLSSHSLPPPNPMIGGE